MARRGIGLQFDGWQELMADLDRLGGREAMKSAVDDALKETQHKIAGNLNEQMVSGNLPAHGKYSTGRTKDSIVDDGNVDWNGLTANVRVGFDLSQSGTTSIFLMYGTQTMPPVRVLKAAVYGARTKRDIQDLQQSIIQGKIEELMGGH